MTSTTATSTTTTTTLPRASVIGYTNMSGPLAFLGSISRVAVAPVADHAAVLAPRVGVVAEDDSVRLAYRQFGSGPDLMMVMGEHGTMTWWDPRLLDELAQHFTVTIFDLPGVGYSAPSPMALTLANEADLVAGLSLSLGLTSPTLLGWGLGGTVALDAELRHAGVFARLVLIDAPAPGKLDVPAAAAVERAFASTVATTTGLSRWLFPSGDAAAQHGWLTRLAEVTPDDETAASVEVQARLAASVRGARGIAAGLAGVRVPVEVVTGDSDVVVPPENAKRLAASIPRARLVHLDGGYGALASDSAELVADLTRFVTAH